MRDRQPSVCVFAPNIYLSITVEPGRGERSDEIHLHPGGQGFWVARLLRRLGEPAMLVGALGGEIGQVLSGLICGWDVGLAAVGTEADSACYVFDRRSGKRLEVARSSFDALDRHEIDELYGATLRHAADASLCVVTGRADGDWMPVDMFERLGADLASTGASVVADLHGAELSAFQAGGPIAVLKVSDEDLADDGVLEYSASLAARVEAARKLQNAGADAVVVSASDGPTLGAFGETLLVAQAPRLQVVDHRGSGDSMTAGLATSFMRGLSPEATLRLACGAGAANVTRHGLGTASNELVEQLAAQVQIEAVEGSDVRGGAG